MKEIALTKGQFALVDDADFEWLSQWKWRAFWDWHTKSYYARSSEKGKTHKTRRELRMHRLILGLEPGDKRHGDHIDGNTLNNQRSNLRIANVCQSNQNRRTPKSNTSGHKHVGWNLGAWRVCMRVNGITTKAERYKSKEDAIARANELRNQLQGEFVRVE